MSLFFLWRRAEPLQRLTKIQRACPLVAPVVILTLNAAVVAGLTTVAMKVPLSNLLEAKNEMMHTKIKVRLQKQEKNKIKSKKW